MSFWTFGLFPLFGSYEIHWYEHSYSGFCVNVFSVLLGAYLIARLYGNLMFNILRNYHTVFQKDCILHSHQQCMRVPVSPFHSHLSQLDWIRPFSYFLTETAFGKVIGNIRVPKFRVCSQSSLCLTYKQHLTQLITHSSLVHFFLLLASRIPHTFFSLPLTPHFIGQSFSVSFVVSSFLPAF